MPPNKQQKLTLFMSKSRTDITESLQGIDNNETGSPPTAESTESATCHRDEFVTGARENYQNKFNINYCL